MKKIYLTMAFLWVNILLAQNIQNVNWVITTNGGLDFYPGPATPLGSNVGNATVTHAAVSDQQGNLLFYTNGRSVWGSAALPVSGGLTGFGGDYTQPTVIVPDPDDINKYYIITISVGQIIPGESFHGLRSTKVDMTTGTPVVTDANVALKDESGTPIDDVYPANFGKITTAAHSNGLDYWLIANIRGRILPYLIDDTGIHLQTGSVVAEPLPSALYIPVSGQYSTVNGPMKISPNNQLLLLGYSDTQIAGVSDGGMLYVGNFDPGTGVVSDFLLLDRPAIVAARALEGAEFSPDNGTVHRLFDGFTVASTITVDPGKEIQESAVTQAESIYSHNLQRAMDGRIYFENGDASTGFPEFIGVITSPDTTPYNYMFNAVDVGSSTTAESMNLPTWVQWQPCRRTLTTSISVTAALDREREHWISSSDVFTGASAVGRYHAGQYVMLTPGFETAGSAGFLAYIEECTGLYDTYRDGQSEPAAIKNEWVVANRQLKVYPNPSSTSVTIACETEKLETITVFSLDGKIMQHVAADGNEHKIDVSALAHGVYLIKAQTSDGKISNAKFIKN